MEALIPSALAGDKLGMVAALDDAAAINDEDAVGIGDGGEAMRDDQRRAPGRKLGQRLLDRPLRLRIQRRGRLVEDQDRRVLQEDASNGETLLLAAGELHPALADDRVEAVGKVGDDVVEARAFRRVEDLLLRRIEDAGRTRLLSVVGTH